MQEAFGGILNLVLITLFLVIVSSTLALIVSYNKAFKMKNIVISNLERYEDAKCTETGSACYKKIHKEAESIAYHSNPVLNCNGMTPDAGRLFCYEKDQRENGVVYRIVTQVEVDFPIVNRILGFQFFQVSGKTRLIKDPLVSGEG